MRSRKLKKTADYYYASEFYVFGRQAVLCAALIIVPLSADCRCYRDSVASEQSVTLQAQCVGIMSNKHADSGD